MNIYHFFEELIILAIKTPKKSAFFTFLTVKQPQKVLFFMFCTLLLLVKVVSSVLKLEVKGKLD